MYCVKLIHGLITKKRYTTLSKIIIKKTGIRQEYDRIKLENSIRISCIKRPVSEQVIQEANRVLNVQIKGIKSLSQTFNLKFIKLIKGIMKTKGRIIVTGMGKSGHVANKITSTLASTGTPAFFVHPAEASHGDLGMITKDDCILALSNSGESSELNAIINYAKRYNVPLYSITSNSKSLLYKKSTVGLILNSPFE